jgi:hypothetical protein
MRSNLASANRGISKKARFARLRVMDISEVGKPHRRMRLSNIVQGQLDVRVDPLYDYFQVPINTAVVLENLFTIAFGQMYTPPTATAFAKTLYHTNSTNPNSLDAPKKLLVKNISLVPRPDVVPDDLNALIGQYLVTFQTLGKEFWQGHGLKLPGGGGPFTSGIGWNGSGTTAAQSALGTANGWPSANNIALITDDVPEIPGYAPPPPITGVLLETNQPFGVTVDPTQTKGTIYTTANGATTKPGITGVGIIAWVYLEGIKLVAVV